MRPNPTRWLPHFRFVVLPLVLAVCLNVMPTGAEARDRTAAAERSAALTGTPKLALPHRATVGPPSLEDIFALARELATVSAVDDRADSMPTPIPGDPGLPSIGLRRLIDKIGALPGRADPLAARALRDAHEAATDAWQTYAAGSPRLGHLGGTTDALLRALRALRLAAEHGGPDLEVAAAAVQVDIAALAKRMAGDVIGVARRAAGPTGRLPAVQRLFELGDLAAAKGDMVVAVAHFGNALKLAANTITFDVALFEENIKTALAGQTVGHAFSIAYLGQLYQNGESAGFARTAADDPQTAQSPGKETHVASVSKPLTTIVTLRLLEDNGLTPDEPIAPYLPADWVYDPAIGAPGPNQLTFRHFFTHTSGFGQLGAGSDYAGLQSAIGLVGGPLSFNYQNANFGLMRVLVPGLLGIDVTAYDGWDPAALAAAAFILYAQQIYDSIGVEVNCASNDAAPTVQYDLPDGGVPGYVEPNRQLTCGGYGWFISSNELASVLTNLRNTENLLSAESRALMQEGFLGFMDPADWSFIGGTFGVYSMHGGDWFHGGRELHSCVVAFPIQVEVGLVINSTRGGAMPYQCTLLQSAFDNAWVQQ